MAVTLCRLLVLTLCTYIRCPISLPFLFCMELRRSITEIILLPFSFLPRSQHFTDIVTPTPCLHSQQQRPHRVRVVNDCAYTQFWKVIKLTFVTLLLSFFFFQIFFLLLCQRSRGIRWNGVGHFVDCADIMPASCWHSVRAVNDYGDTHFKNS